MILAWAGHKRNLWELEYGCATGVSKLGVCCQGSRYQSLWVSYHCWCPSSSISQGLEPSRSLCWGPGLYATCRIRSSKKSKRTNRNSSYPCGFKFVFLGSYWFFTSLILGRDFIHNCPPCWLTYSLLTRKCRGKSLL